MKFSIRDLLLVTVIVALAVGWCVERQSRIQMQKEISAWRRLWLEQEREHLREIGAYKTYMRQLGFEFTENSLTLKTPAPNLSKP